MLAPLIQEQLDILRRIAERGMKVAHDSDPRLVDTFQHLLDEIALTKKYGAIDGR